MDLPVPKPGAAVAVYAASSSLPGMLPQALALLSKVERSRAARFRRDEDRLSYVAAHLLMLRCLQSALGRAEVAIEVDALGKPRLAHSASPRLSFSISHTQDFVACALVHDAEIGIDAERLSHAGSRERIADALAPDERAWRDAMSGAARREALLALWTLKEAIVKADGRGLRLPFDGFTVEPERGAVRFAAGEPAGDRPWRLWRRVDGDLRLAVAVTGTSLPSELTWAKVDLDALLPQA